MRYSYPEGVFHIDPMPGQPQVAHCHGFFVMPDWRGTGKAHLLKNRQKYALRTANYDYAVCTVDGKNEAQKRVLTKAGWMPLADFTNSKTEALTEIWGWPVSKGSAA